MERIYVRKHTPKLLSALKYVSSEYATDAPSDVLLSMLYTNVSSVNARQVSKVAVRNISDAIPLWVLSHSLP